MQPGTGTVTEEHLRASLLSAVEDKMKRKLREFFAQAQVCVTCVHTCLWESWRESVSASWRESQCGQVGERVSVGRLERVSVGKLERES